MYDGSIPHDRIIEAFRRYVPGVYVRDYRDRSGWITICRGVKDIPWRGQTTTQKVYRQVPDETLCNLPRGNMPAVELYNGAELVRPGWRRQFRLAGARLSDAQKRAITRYLGRGQVFR